VILIFGGGRLSGTLAKLRKLAIYFFESIRLFVHLPFHMEQFGAHWTDFHKI
jgi:hypothetical protein